MKQLVEAMQFLIIWIIWIWGLFDSGKSEELRACFLFFGSVAAAVWTIDILNKKSN